MLTLSAVTLIGAILTNTMTTAVIERRSEFGLRRAIGARRAHITSLVLTEALTIGTLGGISGTYLATLALLAITIIQGWQPVLDPTTIPIGIGIGITIAPSAASSPPSKPHKHNPPRHYTHKRCTAALPPAAK